MEMIVNPKASEWILKQPWLSQFVDNCIARGTPPDIILAYFLGKESFNTVNNAFYWADTPEGRDFWEDIDDEMAKVSDKENWNDSDIIIEI